MSLFGNASASGANTGSSSLFGNTAASSAPQSNSLFGAGGNTASSAPTGGSLFGNATANKPSLFGTSTAASQPASNNLFGGAGANNASSGTTSLFGQSAAPKPTGLFGAPATGFGASTAQNQTQNQNQASTNQPGQSTMLPPAQPDLSQSMMDSRRIWNEEDGAPRSRTVLEQLQLVNKKWDPNNPQHAFQTYLYNQVHPDAQPFYRPGPTESEDAWEEALRKAPNAGAIPFRVRGFHELGVRIVSQRQHLDILSGRLHEINNGLTALLRKHELEITSRTAAARRRHAALSQRVLTLATKTMMARNRGYALDTAEEELRKKLVTMERGVMDPALSGREEEIWARMVSVRERGKLLEMELQRAGLDNLEDGQKQEISEEVLKQAKKILEDYDSQLTHLTKELEQIKTDWTEWEDSKK